MWRPDGFAMPLTQLASQLRPDCVNNIQILRWPANGSWPGTCSWEVRYWEVDRVQRRGRAGKVGLIVGEANQVSLRILFELRSQTIRLLTFSEPNRCYIARKKC